MTPKEIFIKQLSKLPGTRVRDIQIVVDRAFKDLAEEGYEVRDATVQSDGKPALGRVEPYNHS